MSAVALLVLRAISLSTVMELAPSTLPAFPRSRACECSALDSDTDTRGYAVCPYSMVFLSWWSDPAFVQLQLLVRVHLNISRVGRKRLKILKPTDNTWELAHKSDCKDCSDHCTLSKPLERGNNGCQGRVERWCLHGCCLLSPLPPSWTL